ncbi:oxidoreductase [Novosphingobium marinum]|uniref:NAD(P)-dependent dehydrogenase (Short-subunit alcohol dehydrogenase family) n=1 Tax=Novosphingobium marinum TaxID=1514948 RepID=A0A7Y9XVV0_9SPHN|nr:SDR family oxidoreductase [Novosphingobium marinum]NYH94036.1 NAD(P)-dependent dehydrogenase (short-subunit alcohol dehydrogenase family) [Novosphingobium marinum]GGC19120.1 oxidoreductase [Novosphingobium marinum]
MDLGLKGKKVIIGGATRGLSRESVKVFAQEGADIGMFSRSGDGLKELSSELGSHGGKYVTREFSLEDRDDYKSMLSGLADELGGCDVFVHSISSSGAQGAQDWEESFRIDILGAVDAVEALEPYLEKSSDGSIIMMSSTAAVETFIVPQAFNAIKAGLLTYASQLSQALAPKGIRVNSVSPGPITYPGGNWDGIKAAMPELYDNIEGQIPLGRMGNPDDVAPALVFLASPAAKYITGANLIIDGGFTKRIQF